MKPTIDITCDVCQDLIPLVKDEVASEDSRNLIQQHMEHCDGCSALYNDLDKPQLQDLNDQKNILTIKRNLYFFGFSILAMGAFLGVYLSNSMGMFYNFIIMPVVGALGYIIFKKRWYFVPLGVFLLTYVWLLIGFILEYNVITAEIFTYPMSLAPIYTLLTAIGVMIGALLKFALKKEEKSYEL